MKNTRILPTSLVFGLITLIAVSIVPYGSAHAAGISPEPIIPSPISCAPFTTDLYIGLTDASTNGDVTRLQTFLSEKGYFNATPIGIFGPITFAAAQHFQAANGVPSTGYVGPLTRGAINTMCNGTVPPTPSPVSITNITPTSGAVGTQVMITGRGFTANNNIHFAGGGIYNVPVASTLAIDCSLITACQGGLLQTLEFTIPSSIGAYCPPGEMKACPAFAQLITSGDYQVSVENSNGTSNAETFTVTSGSVIPPGPPLSISGLDAPAHLSVNAVGTFTVHVSNVGESSNLHYSVLWGDEVQSLNASSATSFAATTQPIETVTHAYAHPGTYTPTFTVSNDAGQSATISATVLVN